MVKLVRLIGISLKSCNLLNKSCNVAFHKRVACCLTQIVYESYILPVSFMCCYYQCLMVLIQWPVYSLGELVVYN